VVILGIAIWAGIRLFDNPNSETPNNAYVTGDFTLVAPRVAGELSEVLVEDNQQVKAGQLLVRIDDRPRLSGGIDECAGGRGGSNSIGYELRMPRSRGLSTRRVPRITQMQLRSSLSERTPRATRISRKPAREGHRSNSKLRARWPSNSRSSPATRLFLWRLSKT
jgi:hypothetical protein